MKKLLLGVVLALLTLSARADNGGPDAGGYAFERTFSPQTFVSIVGHPNAIPTAGVNPVSDQDDIDYDTELGFTFPFYGVNYTHVHFSTNGLICLGDTGSAAYNNADLTTTSVDPLSGPGSDLPAIAVLWDDLQFFAGQPGGLWIEKRTIDGMKEFVVEWDRVPVRVNGPSLTFTFQAILREDGSITLHYPDADVTGLHNFAASGTIGIRAPSGHTNGKRLQMKYGTDVGGTGYLSNGERIDIRVLPDAPTQAVDFTGRQSSPRLFTNLATEGTQLGDADPDVVPGVPEGHSVWFKWTSPGSGKVSFSTAGSSFDTVLAVLNGAQILTLGSDDDGGGDGTSRVGRLSCNGETTFLIMVGGKNIGGTVTSGLAQVSANFEPAERVSFERTFVQAAEGLPVTFSLTRAFVNSGPIDVTVGFFNPNGVYDPITVHADAGQQLPDITFTPVNDDKFTPVRTIGIEIQDSDSVVGGDTGTVEVFDNDPIVLPSQTYLGALGSQVGNERANGFLTLTLGKTGGLSGKIQQGAATYAFKGQIDAQGRVTLNIPRKGLPQLTLVVGLQETTIFSTPTLACSVSVFDSGSIGGAFGLQSALYSAKNPVSPGTEGRYTFSMKDDPSGLQGYGTGTITKTGVVKFAGVLFDGFKFSFGSRLTGVPGLSNLAGYAKTHGGKGFFQFNTHNVGPNANIVFRPAGIVDKTTSAFDAGFYKAVDVALTYYTAPAPGTLPDLGFITSMGVGTFGLDDPFALALPVDFTLQSNGKSTSATAGFALTFDPKTGLYRGTRPNPTVGGKPIPFGGAFIQTISRGVGISHDATTAHSAFILPKP